MRWLVRFRKKEAGGALVEFAISIPFLLLIVWVVVDFARAHYTISALASAVREGARYAAIQTDPTSKTAEIKTRVQSTFNAFGGTQIPAAQIFVYDSSAVVGVGRVTVEVKDYAWQPFTPIDFITGGQILLTRRATFRWERAP